MKNDIKNVLYIGIAFAAFLILLSNLTIAGNWNEMVTNIIPLFGWFFLVGLSFTLLVMKEDASMGVSIIFCGIAGVGLSGLIGHLYNNGIYFDTIINAPNTLTDIQTVIIIFWLLIGVAIGVLRNER